MLLRDDPNQIPATQAGDVTVLRRRPRWSFLRPGQAQRGNHREQHEEQRRIHPNARTTVVGGGPVDAPPTPTVSRAGPSCLSVVRTPMALIRFHGELSFYFPLPFFVSLLFSFSRAVSTASAFSRVASVFLMSSSGLTGFAAFSTGGGGKSGGGVGALTGRRDPKTPVSGTMTPA